MQICWYNFLDLSWLILYKYWWDQPTYPNFNILLHNVFFNATERTIHLQYLPRDSFGMFLFFLFPIFQEHLIAKPMSLAFLVEPLGSPLSVCWMTWACPILLQDFLTKWNLSLFKKDMAMYFPFQLLLTRLCDIIVKLFVGSLLDILRSFMHDSLGWLLQTQN